MLFRSKSPGTIKAEEGQLARIEVRPSFFDSVSESGQELILSAKEVTQRINALLSEDNQRQIMKSVHSLEQTAGRFSALASAMEPTVKALPALVNDTGVALRRADALMGNIDRRLDSIERAAKGAERLTESGEIGRAHV